MAFSEKRLAQAYPAGAVNTDAYTVPAGKKAIARNIVICNTTGADIAFRIFVVPNGQSPGVENAIFYNYVAPANFSFSKNMYVLLDTPGDKLTVYAQTQGITFTVSGAEVS